MNELEINVVNHWINRYHRLPETQRMTWTYYDWYSADVKLQPSGLKGPVKLEIVR